MITLLLVIIVIHLIFDTSEEEFEIAEMAKERRHKELMEIERQKLKNKKSTKFRTRTIVKDTNGTILAQEVSCDDDDDDDEDCIMQFIEM